MENFQIIFDSIMVISYGILDNEDDRELFLLTMNKKCENLKASFLKKRIEGVTMKLSPTMDLHLQGSWSRPNFNGFKLHGKKVIQEILYLGYLRDRPLVV